MTQQHMDAGGAEMSEMPGLSEPSGVSGLSGRTISRRTVALGAAWSVPVVMVAVAAPAAAASLDFSSQVSGSATARKDTGSKPGTKLLHFTLTLTNTSATAATVPVLSLAKDGSVVPATGLPTTVVVPAGGSTVVTYDYTYPSSAGEADYVTTYQVSGVLKTTAPTHV